MKKTLALTIGTLLLISLALEVPSLPLPLTNYGLRYDAVWMLFTSGAGLLIFYGLRGWPNADK
jgi:hypothetical protein